MKICIKCNQEKPLQEYPTYKSRIPGAPLLRRNYCKICKDNYTVTQCQCGKPKHKKSELCQDCREKTYIKDHKICPGCKLEKSYVEYHMRKEKGEYLVPKSYCKECCKIRGRISGPRKFISPILCECGQPKEKRSKLCSCCNLQSRRIDYTLGEAIYNEGTKGSTYSLIRSRARSIMQDKACERCGYSIHVETCHIKPINKFSLESKLSEINHPDNLISLCRNCHWEFDHGLLTLDQIKKCGL